MVYMDTVKVQIHGIIMDTDCPPQISGLVKSLYIHLGKYVQVWDFYVQSIKTPSALHKYYTCHRTIVMLCISSSPASS